MLGAIAGDIIGSVYEGNNIRRTDFPLFKKSSHFTDDTVLTAALFDSINSNVDYRIKLLEYYRLYPNVAYGGMFHKWALSGGKAPYNSFGNGSAMRVSPAGWFYDNIETVLLKAKESAEVTHNHPEGIKGAQAVASAIFLAREGKSKGEIKEFIEERFHYSLDFSLKELQKSYRFDSSCQGSVPQAIFTFLVSEDFEDSIRKAISIGGDSDTIACISGAIAEAYYNVVPEEIVSGVLTRLDERLCGLVNEFINLKKRRTI